MYYSLSTFISFLIIWLFITLTFHLVKTVLILASGLHLCTLFSETAEVFSIHVCVIKSQACIIFKECYVI